MAEMHLHPDLPRQDFMRSHLLSLVTGDALSHFLGDVALQSINHDIPRLPFHNHAARLFVILANDEIAFPMTRNTPPLHVFRPFINKPDIGELPTSLLTPFRLPFTLLVKFLHLPDDATMMRFDTGTNTTPD